MADPAREDAVADHALGRENTENVAMVERELAILDIEDAIAVQGAGDEIRILEGEFPGADGDSRQVRFRDRAERTGLAPCIPNTPSSDEAPPGLWEDLADRPFAASWFGAAVSEQEMVKRQRR